MAPDLEQALVDGNRKRLQRLVTDFAAAAGSTELPGVREAQAAAIRAYNRRVRAIDRQSAAVEIERRRLEQELD